MCGIVGYAGAKQAAPILLDGLTKLEYRGYDSAGLAIIGENAIDVQKSQGRLAVLSDLTQGGTTLKGVTGIGHTRWATHGEPSDRNAHPHVSNSGSVAVVHNGIVENYMELKRFLTAHGHTFISDTDTEVISHLMEHCYKGDPLKAATEAVAMLEGAFALGILFEDCPNMIIAVRKDSPLIVGLGEGENFIASDVPAILKHTRNILRLEEREMVVLKPDSVKVYDRHGDLVEKQPEVITWDVESAEKGGHEHFMIKEMLEQPKAIRDTLSPRIKDGEVHLELKNIDDDYIRGIESIHIVACGSAWHAGCVGRVLLQDALRIPVSCELASEFRYNQPLVNDKTLLIIISQSGETIDTLFALREGRRLGARVLSIVNVVGSAIANASDDVLYTWAGPEIAVATTKGYSTQLAMLYLITLHMGAVRGGIDKAKIKERVDALVELPDRLEKMIEGKAYIQQLASKLFNQKDVFFIGRHLDYALALEGSLKLKEISYIHSDAYPAGELKHGTISLVEDGTLIIALCTHRPLHEKMCSNIQEVKARGATVIAVCQDDAKNIIDAADYVFPLPADADTFTLSSLCIIPLQLFSYYVASLKGCDIDKPRNLAKSVTVE